VLIVVASCIAWLVIRDIISELFGDLNLKDENGMIAAGRIFGVFLLVMIAICWIFVGGVVRLVQVTDAKIILALLRQERMRLKDAETGTEMLEKEDWRYRT
jgi:hypothetical protein